MFFINFFEYTGTIAFAISGALLGCKKQLDYFGIIILSIITAIGGGIIRDVLVGNLPPNALKEPVYIALSIITAVVTIVYHQKLYYFHNTILLFDALGLGVFTAIGANVALQNRMMQPIIVITLGLMTGVGGGIARDIFINEIPLVFRREIYALASIAGAFAFYLTHIFLPGIYPLYICFIVTFVIRVFAIIYSLHLPVINIQKSEAKIKREICGS
jgi:uncharacterized membrane protein YeiH